MENTLKSIRKVEGIIDQMANEANMTLLPIPFSSFKAVTDMYQIIVKDLVSRINYHPENQHDVTADKVCDKLRLFDAYMREYRIIDGINQHPEELNFTEWNDRRIKDILKERFSDDEIYSRGSNERHQMVRIRKVYGTMGQWAIEKDIHGICEIPSMGHRLRGA